MCAVELIFSWNYSFDRDTERNKDLAFLEAQIYEYVEILGVSISVLFPYL